jgi:anti-sigma factor RsiW
VSAAPLDEALIQGFVDGQLDQAQQAEVERYLALHPTDAERVNAYREQRASIKAAFEAVLHEPVPRQMHGLRVRRSRGVRVAAAILWIALGGLAGWMLRGEIGAKPQATVDTELIERARVAHVIYTAENRRAVEVAASQEEDMIRWLSKRMNAAVHVPKLNEFGFEALGGRLLPGMQGPACQIMYQNAAGKRLTIYLARDPQGAPKPVRFSDKEAVQVVAWSDGTLAFAVSAELGAEELQRIAAAVAQKSRL